MKARFVQKDKMSAADGIAPWVENPKKVQERPFHCIKCDRRFKNLYSLKVHRTTFHSGANDQEEVMSCELCALDMPRSKLYKHRMKCRKQQWEVREEEGAGGGV